MKISNVTAIILAKDAAETINDTLKSLSFAEKIIVLDDQSSDNTPHIASQAGAQVVRLQGLDFSEKRTHGLKLSTTDWIFYVDADEIITPMLEEKIAAIVQNNQIGSYKVKRRNYFLGTEMYPDYVDRLFHRSVIQGWTGKVHESPILTTPPQTIEAALIHHTHRDIGSMLAKTNDWSEYEAQLRFDAHHPLMSWWRLIRIGLTVSWDQFIHRRVGQYGRAGVFEGYFQIIDKLIVYTKLWEKQHSQNLS